MPKSASISDEPAHAIADAIQEAAAEISTELKAMIRQEFDQFSKTFTTKIELERTASRLIRWMFAFWLGQMTVAAGLVFEVAKLLK